MKLFFGGNAGEIVGPAGAGKSSLAELINRSQNGVRAGASVWRLPRRKLAETFVRFFPELVRLRLEHDDFALTDMKRLIRLETLYRKLTANGAGASGQRSAPLILMDEGLIFTLAKIRVERGYFPRWLDDSRLAPAERWGKVLKMIVWLDAPDEFLIDRIRRREKTHRMKFRSAHEIEVFLDRYRAAYESVFERLRGAVDFKILRFDTARHGAEEIASRIVPQIFA